MQENQQTHNTKMTKERYALLVELVNEYSGIIEKDYQPTLHPDSEDYFKADFILTRIWQLQGAIEASNINDKIVA